MTLCDAIGRAHLICKHSLRFPVQELNDRQPQSCDVGQKRATAPHKQCLLLVEADIGLTQLQGCTMSAISAKRPSSLCRHQDRLPWGVVTGMNCRFIPSSFSCSPSNRLDCVSSLRQRKNCRKEQAMFEFLAFIQSPEQYQAVWRDGELFITRIHGTDERQVPAGPTLEGGEQTIPMTIEPDRILQPTTPASA